MDALVNSLTKPQQALLRETEAGALTGLDEDELLALHLRIRRARDKHVGIYRRQASGRVSTVGGRGKARPKNRRNFDRAEVFEDALARVSRRLAAVARQSAAEIKAERIAAARNERAVAPPPPGRRAVNTRASQVTDRTMNTGATRRQRAANQAAGARRQAKRDNARSA
jgi:hypothetical protein